MIFEDKERFKEVFMKHYVPLCNYANSLVRDEMLAEDIVQDVFLHLWKNNDTLTITSKLQSFLFTAVKNKVFEQSRSNTAYRKALDSVKNMNNDHLTSDDDMSSESAKYMAKERVSSLLRQLPTKCRQVFALHKLNGLTYAEIATQKGISIKTVENHMLKAMKILRSEYSKNNSKTIG